MGQYGQQRLRTKSRNFVKNTIAVVFVKTYFFPISLYARRRFFILFPLSPNAESNKYLPKYRSVCVPTQYAFRVKRTMHIVILLCTYGFFLFDVSPFDKLPFCCRVPNNCQLSIKRPRREKSEIVHVVVVIFTRHAFVVRSYTLIN